MHKEKEHLFFEEILSKLLRYCSYQARSEQEVHQKAKELTTDKEAIEKLLKFLREENYIDDKEFATEYIRGKMNQKKWGRYKIKQGLKLKGISNSTIDNAINRIDEQRYIENLQTLIEKRNSGLKLDSKEKRKLYHYLLNKGYESNLIIDHLP